jgi:hypothetical protein
MSAVVADCRSGQRGAHNARSGAKWVSGQIVFGQPDKARRPLTHPQLAMMHFVYEIRVTLSTKIFMFPASLAVAISM